MFHQLVSTPSDPFIGNAGAPSDAPTQLDTMIEVCEEEQKSIISQALRQMIDEALAFQGASDDGKFFRGGSRSSPESVVRPMGIVQVSNDVNPVTAEDYAEFWISMEQWSNPIPVACLVPFRVRA